jgi:hypothetical protein
VFGKYAILTINGRGFVPESTVKLKAQGQPDIVATEINAASNGKTLTAKVALDAVEMGKRDVVVTGKPGFETTLPGAFGIRASVSSVSPSSMNAAANTVDVTFKGSGFAADMAVKLTRSGSPDWVASSVKYNSNSEIVVTFTESGTEPMGKWTIMMGRPDYIAVDGISETNVQTSIETVSPNHLRLGQTTTVAIKMIGVVSGITVKLESSGRPDIEGKNARYSSGYITVDFTIPADANGVPWNLVLTCPNGRVIVSPIDVQSGAGVWEFTPAVLGKALASARIACSGFSADCIAKLIRAGSSDIVGKTIDFKKDNSITATDTVVSQFDLTNAAAGVYDLVLSDASSSVTIERVATVELPKYDVSVRLNGRTIARTGVGLDVQIAVRNNGNVDNVGNLSIFGLPKGIYYEVRDENDKVADLYKSPGEETDEVFVPGVYVWPNTTRTYHLLLKSSAEIDMEIAVAWVGISKD